MNIGFYFALAAAVIWGLVYVLDEKILHNLSTVSFLFISSLVTFVILLPIVLFNRSSLKEMSSIGKAELPLIILTEVLTLLANFLILLGIKSLNASVATIIEIAYPFFVVLFSYILFRSTPNISFFIGGAFIFIGSVIIARFAG